jgi:proteasome lid subunit RPN8/RPN11
MSDRFELAPGLAGQIIAHARECFPEEACGIIAGAGSAGSMLYRGRNLSPTPRVAFDLDRDTLARQLDFEHAGLTMTAVYHSHPAGPDTPTSLDITRAAEGYPDSVILICSLAEIDKPVLHAFRIDRGRVREVVLVPGREDPALTNPQQGSTLHVKESVFDVILS